MDGHFPTEGFPLLTVLKPALTVVAGDLCMDADKGDEAHAEGQMKLAAKFLDLFPTPASSAMPGDYYMRYPSDQDASGGNSVLWRRHLGPRAICSFSRTSPGYS